MKVPFYNIDRVYQQHQSEILNTIHQVFSSGNVLMGKEISETEERIANFCNRKYGVLLGSCTDALYFALKASGVKPSDEVLVTAFSFIASATPILRLGAIPVFVDIEPNYFMMDIQDLENKITPRTKALIGVHLFGQTFDIERVTELCNRNNIVLIEDAAQSFGSLSGSAMAGSFGLCSCISFDPTKVIGAFGNGGILLTNETAIYEYVKKLHYHGKNENGAFEIIGYNSRMASSQAALLNKQMNLLENWIQKRQEIAEIYTTHLSEISQIIPPKIRKNGKHIFHKYVIKTERRDALKQHLNEMNVGCMIHYNTAIPDYPLFNQTAHKAEKLANISSISKQVLSLPIYPELSDKEIVYVLDVIKSFFDK